MDKRRPLVPQPFGCVAEISPVLLGDKTRSGGFRGYEAEVTMAYDARPRTIASDRISAPHAWSEGNVPARAAEIAQRAAGVAVTVCATCTASGCGDTLGRQIELATLQNEKARLELERAQLGQAPATEQ